MRLLLKKAYHSINLQHNLQLMYGRNDNTTESIRMRVQKFTHDKLSTNKIDHKYYNQCEYCKKCKTEEIEDEGRRSCHPIFISKKMTATSRLLVEQNKGVYMQDMYSRKCEDAMYYRLDSWLEPSCRNIDQDFGTAL